MADEFGEKSEPATEKKLRDARKKGQVARSVELNSFFLLFFQLLTFFAFRGYFWDKINSLLPGALSLINEPIGGVEMASFWMRHWIVQVVLLLLPLLLSGFCFGLLVNIFQVGWVISTEHISSPNWKRFNLFDPTNYQKFFQSRTLMRSVLGISKMSCIIAIAYFVLSFFSLRWLSLLWSYTGKILPNLFSQVFWLFFFCALFLLLLGVGDFLFQKWKFSDDMKMSKQEIKEEYKQMEGDPKIRSRIRAMMQEMASGRAESAVSEASVVIANPTHYAIALKYDVETMISPLCVAKGMQYKAERIREIAKEHQVPIVENPPLARGLYRVIEIGDAVPSEFYHAVAEVLAHVYQLNEQMKQRFSSLSSS